MNSQKFARGTKHERLAGSLLEYPSRAVRRSATVAVMLAPAVLVFFVDRLIKHFVMTSLRLGESITVVPGILSLTHVKNPGAAYGVLGDRGSVVLLVASILALAVLAWVLRWFLTSFTSRVGSGLVFGGAASNLVDRLFAGAVTDYLELRLWWVFNLADAAILVGAVALVFSFLSSLATR